MDKQLEGYKHMISELKTKLENLQLEMEQTKQDYYFNMRNKEMEIVVLKNQLREARGE